MGIWKGKALSSSEIIELYNGGIGLSYPFTTATTQINITFKSQNPSDVTSTTLFSQNVNIAYNISNRTDMSNAVLQYKVNHNDLCYGYLNGSCYFLNNTYYNTTSTTNTTQIFNWSLGENNIYHSNNYLNYPYFNQTHNIYTLNSPNDLYDMQIINFSTTDNLNYYEAMVTSTGITGLYYCNSSYSTGNPATSGDCNQIYSGIIGFNHTHNAFSNHSLFVFNQNSSGYIGQVKSTSTSHFVFKGSSSNTVNLYYISNTTGRTNTFRTSINNGVIFTDESTTQTLDSHIHQFSLTDDLIYKGCINKSGTFECTNETTERIDQSTFPPTGVQIIIPNTSTYQQYINITYLISPHPNTPTINNSYVNISLFYTNNSFIKQIIKNNLSTYYYWDTYADNLSIDTNYYLQFNITDTANKTTTTQSDQFNFSANSNLQIEVYNLTNKIQNFSINVTDQTSLITTYYQTNSSGTNGTINISTIKGRSYFIALNPPAEYAIMNTTKLISSTYEIYNFGVILTNSINITILDESTGSVINTQNVSMLFQLSNTTTEYSYNTSSGNLFAYNFIPGTYAIVFSSPNYAVRTYQITIANRSTQSLNAYLVASTSFTVFSFSDLNSLNPLQDVSVTMSKIINSSWTTVESKYTDPTGRIGFYFTTNTKYQFYATKAGYDSKLFVLDPILFTSYNIKMTPNANNTPGYSDVTAYFAPAYIKKNIMTNFSFGIQSPNGLLTSYGYNLTWNCGNRSYTGTNAIGATNVYNFTVTCGNHGDYVNLIYFYTTSIGDYTQNTYNLPIEVDVPLTNYTFYANNDKTYGLGEFERMGITTIFAMLIGGIAGMIGGALIGLGLALFIFGYFVFIGFISGWYLVLPAIVGVIYIFGRREG